MLAPGMGRTDAGTFSRTVACMTGEKSLTSTGGLCVSLPDGGFPDQQDDVPDVAHKPEPQLSVR